MVGLKFDSKTQNTLGVSERLLQECATEDETLYRNNFRMNKDQFEVFLHQLPQKLKNKTQL